MAAATHKHQFLAAFAIAVPVVFPERPGLAVGAYFGAFIRTGFAVLGGCRGKRLCGD
jgi:hypothetical protein